MDLTADVESRLKLLLDVFLAENAKLNLSALREREACWIGNILDSLSFLDIAEELHPLSIADIGTGGGFPLLPLSIALSETHLTGIDATRKKIDAVARIVASLNLSNVSLLSERVEVIGQSKAHREHYDIATARAVAPISTLLEYCSPLVRIGGFVVLWKSMHIEEEMKQSEAAQKILHCPFKKSHVYTLPGDFGTRQLLIFQKGAATPREFPRSVGIPKKEPIV